MCWGTGPPVLSLTWVWRQALGHCAQIVHPVQSGLKNTLLFVEGALSGIICHPVVLWAGCPIVRNFSVSRDHLAGTSSLHFSDSHCFWGLQVYFCIWPSGLFSLLTASLREKSCFSSHCGESASWSVTHPQVEEVEAVRWGCKPDLPYKA